MKKITETRKLMLKPEIVKLLKVSDLKNVVGGGPVSIRQSSCILPEPEPDLERSELS